MPRLAAIAQDLHERAMTRLTEDQIPVHARSVKITADMRYRGQAFEINTPWDGADVVTPESLVTLVQTFHRLHQARYAHSAEADPV